jgi:chromosome segregation ATPase
MAQITEKIVEIKAQVEGGNTVKELKEQIAELTRLMETLDKESAEYHNTVNMLVDAEEELTNVMKVGKSQLSAQEGSYNALVNRMAALKKAHKAVSDEASRSRLSDEINSINEQLKEMDAKNGVYVRNVGNYENAIKEALKTPQQELKALRTQLAQLTEGTDEYNAVFTRMAQLTHDVTEQQEQLKWSSADLGDILGNVAGVATSLAGGFSAFNALSGLIGGESEELEKAMAQAQRFIQLIQGLEQLEQLGDKVKGLWKGIKDYSAGLGEAGEALDATTKAASKNTAVMAGNTTATEANVAATNAQSTANVVATTTTGAFSVALGVLKTALIATGIGAIIVALGALINLLSSGISYVWGWISGANKAKEQTENLQSSFDALNESLEAQEKSWERQEKLMQAQGKSYEEIYEARKKNLQAQLAEAQALLASQQAIAKDIGQRKLQKEKYDDFRKTLEELTAKEKELKQAIDDLDYDKYVKGVEDQTKAEQARIKAKEDAAKAAAEAYKKEKESADKLYKDLQEHYKDDRTKLKEKYEAEKKLLEKYNKDTTNLTRKYQQELTNIELKEEQYRKQLREQLQKDFDASFRYPSLEYFQNQLDNATQKLEDFKVANDLIVKDDAGMHTLSGYADEIKYLEEEYGVTIQSMEHFDSIFKKVILDYEDATKALKDYQTQLAREDTAKLERRLALERELMDFNNEKALLEYDNYVAQAKWNADFTNNYISQMKLRWETEDSIFQKRKERLEAEIKAYKEQAEKITTSEEAKAEALAKAADLERQLALETADYTIAQNQRKGEATENYVTAVQDSLDGISSILSNVASAWETSIQAQVDAGEISEEEGERQMENMRGIQSAIALINAFSSAVSAYNSMASIPFVGPALGAAAAAAALASGIAQVVAINKVKKGDKGGGSESTRYAEVTPTVPDYNPTAVTNVSGGQETENLANAMSGANIWVSVKDIDSAQSKVKTRDKETSF